MVLVLTWGIANAVGSSGTGVVDDNFGVEYTISPRAVFANRSNNSPNIASPYEVPILSNAVINLNHIDETYQPNDSY